MHKHAFLYTCETLQKRDCTERAKKTHCISKYNVKAHTQLV